MNHDRLSCFFIVLCFLKQCHFPVLWNTRWIYTEKDILQDDGGCAAKERRACSGVRMSVWHSESVSVYEEKDFIYIPRQAERTDGKEKPDCLAAARNHMLNN